MTAFLAFLLLVLIAIQGMTMGVDEFIFHRRRGLGTFERWGHVADTGLFFLALLVPAVAMPGPGALWLFGLLAVGSCVLITKDEWIHTKACGGAEHWCHALLFVLHGPILLAAGLLWYLQPDALILKFTPAAIFSWGLYQTYYWNILHADRKRQPTGCEQSVLR